MHIVVTLESLSESRNRAEIDVHIPNEDGTCDYTVAIFTVDPYTLVEMRTRRAPNQTAALALALAFLPDYRIVGIFTV